MGYVGLTAAGVLVIVKIAIHMGLLPHLDKKVKSFLLPGWDKLSEVYKNEKKLSELNLL